jgi:hypothetical protein
MRRTVIGLVLAAVVLMPTAGMAAQRKQISSRSSWLQIVMTWVTHQVNAAQKILVSDPPQPPPPPDDARSIIDPNGDPG